MIKKVILAVCCIMVTAVSAAAFSQQSINLNLTNVSLRQIINELEEQTTYRFVFDNTVDLSQKASVIKHDADIEEIANTMFKSKNISYEISGNQIILKKAAPVRNTVTQQSQEVSGKVIDIDGEPLTGVSVMVKGSSNRGTITDMDGNFLLKGTVGEVLVFTYIGYLRQEVTLTAQTVTVRLEEDVKALEEVVVIGYGTVKRANLSGAVGTADAKAFQSRPITDAASALQGEVPGLVVFRNESGGEPGKNPKFRIRDISTIHEDSAPLVLIDGAEGNLSTINPADIESVSVLKDGTAAIYGARAADGVVLITTKSGSRNQKLRVTFDANFSMKTPALLKKPATLYEHAAMALEITDGSFPIEYTREELELIAQGSDKVIPSGTPWGRWGSAYPKFYKDQDYNKHIIGNGNLQNYNVGFSGGGEKYSYLLSLGHQREEGLPKFGIDNNKRYFVRTKSTIEVAKNLSYDLNVSYEAGSRNYSTGISEDQTVWELIYKTRTWAPMYNPDGTFYTFEGFANPAQLLEEGGESNITSGNFTFNNALTWKVIDGLNVIGRAVVRKNDYDKYCVKKTLYLYNWENVQHNVNRTPNSAEREYAKTLSKNFTLYAEYKKTWGKHDFGVMFGGSNESEDYDLFVAKRINFDQQESMPITLGSPQDQSATSKGNAWTINSFFSRLNYAFANKYLIEATIRGDGSSRFNSDSRWGYFPGASVAWRVSEESFIKSLYIFDDLKFRGSYGEMGNQSGIGHYDYFQLIDISRSYYPFGSGEKGQMARQSNLVSASRTWETIATVNLGADFSVLDNRLYGSFDYFWKRNKNMLIPVTYPDVLGIEAPTTNSGELKVYGWELTVGWRDQIGDFSYSVRANVSDAKNTVVKGGTQIMEQKLMSKTPMEGYPINSYFGWKFDGIIQNEQELAEYKARFPQSGTIQNTNITVGDAKYVDLNNDGNLNENDLVYLGDTNPRYNFGVNLNVAYKGFDIGAFFQGVGKRTMILDWEARRPFNAEWYQSASYWYGKTWTAERTDARYPAISNNSVRKDYNYEMSDNLTHNVAYIRLKNLQLGYTLPKHIVEKSKLEKIRVYFSGEDLFEIHNTPSGWDPEEGGSVTYYPFSRNYSLGINLVF